MRIAWALVMIGVVLGACVLAFAVFGQTSGVAQAAGAGIACALAILPYVGARAADEYRKLPAAEEGDGWPWLSTVGRLAAVFIACLLTWFIVEKLLTNVRIPYFETTAEREDFKRRCAEYKPVFATIQQPDDDQVRFAAKCRDRGHWNP